MELPDTMLLLEPLHCTAEEILERGARDPVAVQDYLDCLEKGWLGQALIERYSYTQAPSTRAGNLQTNAEAQNDKLVKITDEMKDDLRDLLSGGYTKDLVVERDIYSKSLLLHRDDPGRNLLIEVVDMIDQGLKVFHPNALSLHKITDFQKIKKMPKICVVVKNTSGVEYAPEAQLEWGKGVEDAIIRLSEKMFDDTILGMSMEKFGGSLYVAYQVDDEEAALALVDEMEEWC